MIPVSLVIPVRDEAQTIAELMESVQQQTLPPDEILVVDGGSEDATVDMARRLSTSDSRFRIIEAGQATPGRGRNVGIAAARNEWVALTDAGVRLEPQWLEALTRKAEGSDVVYGNLEIDTRSFFERCAALAYAPAKQLRAGSLIRGPSVASAMLRRGVWEAVGGFPDQRAAEDLMFMEAIDKAGFLISWAPEATAWWRLQPTLGATFRKFVVYSEHNVRAGREWDWHYGIAKKYLVILPFVALGIIHSLWWFLVPAAVFAARAGKRILDRREGRGLLWLLNPAQFLGVLLIMVVIDMATFAGWLRGWPQKTRKTQKERTQAI